jgi:hypothetical protein
MQKKQSFSWKKLNRKLHYWGTAIIAIPLLIVLTSGILLQVKKQVTWVQPKTMKGVRGTPPTLTFDQILQAAKSVPEAEIKTWKDIDRLDVRPGKAVIKIRAENRWEIQIDHQSAKILQVDYRRSDIIESIHDGSFFHKHAKLWLFLPSAIVLLALWFTGLYMFILPFLNKRKRKKTTIEASESSSVIIKKSA